jgi:hypothetical protein
MWSYSISYIFGLIMGVLMLFGPVSDLWGEAKQDATQHEVAVGLAELDEGPSSELGEHG